jgi:hypothetical protein
MLLGGVRTGKDGAFQFDDLGRGTHDLVIGAEYLPPEETIQRPVRLGPAERLDLGTLRLPARARLTTIRGMVQNRAGAPLAGVPLKLAEVGHYPEFPFALTDAQGRYVFAGVPGRRYVVTLADADDVSETQPLPIVAGAVAGPPPIQLATQRKSRDGTGGIASDASPTAGPPPMM